MIENEDVLGRRIEVVKHGRKERYRRDGTTTNVTRNFPSKQGEDRGDRAHYQSHAGGSPAAMLRQSPRINGKDLGASFSGG